MRRRRRPAVTGWVNRWLDRGQTQSRVHSTMDVALQTSLAQTQIPSTDLRLSLVSSDKTGQHAHNFTKLSKCLDFYSLAYHTTATRLMHKITFGDWWTALFHGHAWLASIALISTGKRHPLHTYSTWTVNEYIVWTTAPLGSLVTNWCNKYLYAWMK